MANSGSTYQIATGSKVWFTIGLLCFAALLVLAGIFFRERIAFSDTAYQAVYLLIEQKPWINWFRPGSIIPQYIPLTAIWLHADLQTVMILHSLSFILLFLAIYLICYSFSKRMLLFLLAPLYLVLITNEVFYWPQSELQQGMLWLCLYAVLLYEGSLDRFSPGVRYIAHFLFLVWIQSFHPLIFFPILFLLFYYYGAWRYISSRPASVIVTLSAAAFFIRSGLTLFSRYERSKMNLPKFFKINLPHFPALATIQQFFVHFAIYYSVCAMLLVAVLIWQYRQRAFFKVLLVAGGTVSYWLLVMIGSPADIPYHYLENMLLPLAFIVALPLAADILPSYPARYAVPSICLIIAIRVAAIGGAHMKYSEHLHIYDPYLKEITGRKLNGIFLDARRIPPERNTSAWASGYESMLITSLISPDSCRIIQIDSVPEHYEYALNLNTSAVTIYAIWGKTQLPPRYFKLQGGRYEIVH